uniref:PH domain-containing protein n=1 Tax=Rhabditophanes sp. KR3021 TaxID=114890 RepID=A0AC35UDV0_9BILA
MEDDNALDVIKWLFKDETKINFDGKLGVKIGEDLVTSEVKLKGNLLAIKPLFAPIEPMLLIMERVSIEKDDNKPNNFVLTYSAGKMTFQSQSPDDVEGWVLKLATCTHQMAQAECDQSAYKFYNLPSPNESKPLQALGTSNTSIFLTNPYRKCQSFAISQNRNLPSRKIIVEEVMYESKLSFIMPIELLNMYKKWNYEALQEMQAKMRYFSSSLLQNASDNCVKCLRDNDEMYSQAIESISEYSRGFFKTSQEKNRLDLVAVPVNLHVQHFLVENERTGCIVTHGAATAYPMKYVNGGLMRIRNNFSCLLDSPTAVDHTLESRYYRRKRELNLLKRQIGELSAQIDKKWVDLDFEGTVKSALHILAEIKRVHGSLLDLIGSFPDISNIIDSLYEYGKKREMSYGKGGNSPNNLDVSFVVGDSLSNQLDNMEAQIISLNTKVDAMDKLKDTLDNQIACKEGAKTSFNSSLDVLLHLTQSLLHAQIFSILHVMKKLNISQAYYQLQVRSDFVLSQAVTILTTALLSILERCQNKAEIAYWDVYPPLVTFFGFLSCFKDEKGMMEDMKDTMTSLYERVNFRFAKSASSIQKNIIPIISGDRGLVVITLTLPETMLSKLPPKIRNGKEFKIATAYWNLGINHEASFTRFSLSDNSLEQDINLSALKQIRAYVDTHPRKNAHIEALFKELDGTVLLNPSNKNTLIFKCVMALNSALGAGSCFSCKSGKDRTSMGVTLEEGRLLKETSGVTQDQVAEMIVCMRRDGVRRENCRKNVGKAMYSFSPFQMHFIPKEFRPPAGTYTQGVSS